jgi:hypothetical protein
MMATYCLNNTDDKVEKNLKTNAVYTAKNTF